MTLPMTMTERIAALKRFGYNTEEARFICLAALHSGYFVRRQFLAFIDGTKGSKDIVFLDKLQTNRHIEITLFRHNRMVYHLSAKPVYDAIGERDNRNRRERQPSTIKNKLMGLDFVMENQDHHYLATEREKLDYFVKTLGFKPDQLPTRWYASPHGHEATPKHFVDKYPLFLASAEGACSPVVHFCYVDEGQQTTYGFATYLSQYSRLLMSLAEFRVIYIAQDDRLSGSARRVFEAFVGEVSGTPDPEVRQLLAHFEARSQYEAREFSSFDTATLIRYREERKRFSGQRYEELFREWRAGGAAAVRALLEPRHEHKTPLADRFSTYVLEHDYDLFGTLTSRQKEA